MRMPVVDVGGNQMDVISRLLKDRILLLGQQVMDVLWKDALRQAAMGARCLSSPIESTDLSWNLSRLGCCSFSSFALGLRRLLRRCWPREGGWASVLASGDCPRQCSCCLRWRSLPSKYAAFRVPVLAWVSCANSSNTVLEHTCVLRCYKRFTEAFTA